jgi:hypothetical protein
MRVPWLSRSNNNRINGAFFEQVFMRQARSNGLYVKRNELSCRRVGARWLPLKSHLDFMVCTRDGQVGMFDCKSFEAGHFEYARLDSKQVDQAVLLNEWKVSAGFVVYFEKVRQVVFWTGQQIRAQGPRTRFEPSSALVLGRIEQFDTQLLFQRPS